MCSGAALVCASTPDLFPFVIPLAVLALLLGLAGLLLVLAGGRFRWPFPALGTAAGSWAVLAALVFPDLLGPAYQAARARDPVDPAAIRAVPLAVGQGNAAAADPAWVDASRSALQQGGLRVQILSAQVRSVKKKSSGAKKGRPAEELVIRLRLQLVEEGGKFAEKPWTPSVARRDSPGLRLTDSTGKVYPQRDLPEGAAGKQKEHRRAVFPVAIKDEIFVFEAPPRGVENLRLEVPTAAWGGKGTFQFTIPGPMIRNERDGSAGPPGGR